MIRIDITKGLVTSLLTQGCGIDGSIHVARGLPLNCRLWDVIYDVYDLNEVVTLYFLESGESIEDGTEDASLAMQEAKILSIGFNYKPINSGCN